MRLFFYDAAVASEGEDVVFLRFLDDLGRKVTVRVHNVRKYVYVLPSQRNDEEWRASLLRFMTKQTSSLPDAVRIVDTVERRYIIEENHALSDVTLFTRLSCDARHDWNFGRQVVENCSLMSCYLGGDHSVVEQLINEHRLHAWTTLNSRRLSASSTSTIYSCKAEHLHDLIVSTGDTSCTAPPISLAVVFKDLTTDLYTVYNVAKKITYSPLNEQNARRMLSLVNPVATVVHGSSTFVKSFLDYAGVIVNTIDLDKIPVQARCIDDILSVLHRHKFIELSLDLTVYTWQPWSQTTRNSLRLLRVEWLLYKKFHECNVLPPSKHLQRQKEEYKGGLVLQASMGVHDDPILLFDFRSLFPSLCVEYTICWSSNGELLPAVLKDLIEQRKTLQGVPASDIRRLVLKLLANTTYGCMAATSCRYYSPYIAKRITELSRQALQDTADAVQAPGVLVYGDTDSVFVKVAAPARAKEYAAMFVSMINRRYRYLELEHEETYRRVVFVSKKCYVAYPEDERLPPTIKGLKMIKSEYCLAGRYLVETIVKRLGRYRTPEHIFTRCREEVVRLLEDLREGRTPLADLTMTRRINKKMNEYTSRSAVFPYHVQAALHDRKKTYVQGEYVRYVMTEGKKCVCVENIGERKVDVQWYCSQIHGMIVQLLELLSDYDASVFQELLLFSSSSSLSSTTTKRIEYIRHGLSLQCQQCNDYSVHFGLYPLEQLISRQHICTTSAVEICRDDSDEDDYVLDDDDSDVTTSIAESASLACKRCCCFFNFKQALNDALLLDDPWQRASLQLNYDCKRILSLTQCNECRRRIRECISGVQASYRDLMNRLKD